MKKSVSVSNLTLDLWLEYVGPAARAAGILEEVPARDDWHEYTAEVIDEAAANEIAHCMYCACIGSHIEDGDYTSENEARRMLYQLEVSMKYNANTAEVLVLLYNALSAALNPEAAEEAQQESPLDKVAAELEAQKDRSAWGRGVKAYALELVEELRELAAYEGRNPKPGKECREWMLNGAEDWKQYSWGGASLIYDADIAQRLCTPSELKKTRHGERRPNSREEWLDVQARALRQACDRVARVYRSAVTT